MSKQANPTLIGGFIVGAIALLVVGIFVFGSGKWFQETKKFVVYFDESINGLVVGSPVKLHGVQIGQVIDIKVERDNKLKKMLAPVIFEINPEKIINYEDIINGRTSAVVLQEMIQDGLRMQLQVTSMLTGRLFIEARFMPGTPINLVRSSRNGLQEIPSVPSKVQEIQNTVNKILDDLQQIPLQKLFDEILETIQSINAMTSSEETKETLSALNHTMKDLQDIMSRLNKNSGKMSSDLMQTLAKTNNLMSKLDQHAVPILKSTHHTVETANDTLLKLQSTLESVETAGNHVGPVSRNLTTTLTELNKAARSFRLLMDYLEQHPEALIQGKTEMVGE